MYFFAGYVDGDGGAGQLAFHSLHLRPAFSIAFERAFSLLPSRLQSDPDICSSP